MFARILLILIALPFVELFLFFAISGKIGYPLTLLLLFLGTLLGVEVMRNQGFRSLSRYRAEMSQNRLPAESVIDQFLLFLSGLLLFIPGFLTSAAGLLLLCPPLRRSVLHRLENSLRNRFQFVSYTVEHTTGTPFYHSRIPRPDPSDPSGVIDVEAEVIESHPSSHRSNRS